MGRQFAEVKRLIRRLKGNLRVDYAIIFGSRVGDDWLLDSDLDLIVVSPDFESSLFTERAETVLRLWEGKVPLDPICLTPEEFKERKEHITVVREAARKGIPIYP